MVDISEYKVGVVVEVDESSKKGSSGGKSYKICRIQVDETDQPDHFLTVVTIASNVRQGSR